MSGGISGIISASLRLGPDCRGQRRERRRQETWSYSGHMPSTPSPCAPRTSHERANRQLPPLCPLLSFPAVTPVSDIQAVGGDAHHECQQGDGPGHCLRHIHQLKVLDVLLGVGYAANAPPFPYRLGACRSLKVIGAGQGPNSVHASRTRSMWLLHFAAAAGRGARSNDTSCRVTHSFQTT